MLRHSESYNAPIQQRTSEESALSGSSRFLTVPDPIGIGRIGFLVSKKIDPDIAEIDLEMVKMKMADADEGAGWTQEQCEDAEIEYKRYLALSRKFPYPKHSIVPNKIMDTMWHYHILDTRAYCQDCEKVFGRYFHHFPYFGMRGEEDASNLQRAFNKTEGLYELMFGEKMGRAEMQGCWHDCEARCWHACSRTDPSSIHP